MTFVFGSFLGLKAGLGILGLGFFIFCVVWVWGENVGVIFVFFFLVFLKSPILCVCNHLFIGENFLWLEGKVNQDQPLDFKNKSQPFI
jgi:hypothetical protein